VIRQAKSASRGGNNRTISGVYFKLDGITRTVMNNGFCKFPQTRFWHEVGEHLSTLPGVAVTDTADDQQDPERRFLERRLR